MSLDCFVSINLETMYNSMYYSTDVCLLMTDINMANIKGDRYSITFICSKWLFYDSYD